MARRRVEVDRSSSSGRAAIKSESVIVGGRLATTLPELYELLHRIEQRRVETGDWPLLNALLSEALTEAGDSEVVSIASDAAGEESRSPSGGARHRG